MTRGFTLIELLAASVLLGLLAVAIVPVQARWSAQLERLEQQASAERYLDLWRTSPTPPPLESGWRIERIILPPLTATPAPQRLTGYRWVRIIIRDAAGSVLAETLVAERIVAP